MASEVATRSSPPEVDPATSVKWRRVVQFATTGVSAGVTYFVLDHLGVLAGTDGPGSSRHRIRLVLLLAAVRLSR